MLIDTDVMIWNFRGNNAAAKHLDQAPEFSVSAVSYMELLQGMRNKKELQLLRQALHYWDAEIIPITAPISSRAMYFVEEYALSHSMQMADALIAATAIDHGRTLFTANDKHYRHIGDLDLKIFRPD